MNLKKRMCSTEMSKVEKASFLIFSIIFILAIMYAYLNILQSSLKSFPAGMAWLTDVMAHAEKLDSMAYMIYGIFTVSFIFGFPFVFLASVMACIFLIPHWKGKYFGLALLFPGMFTFVFVIIALTGHFFA